MYLGIDLGGTKMLAGLVNADGRVLARDLQPTHASLGQDDVIRRMAASARGLVDQARSQGLDVRAVGVGAPGPVNSREGILHSPPHLPGWDRVPLASLLEEALGIPTHLENDANAAALGENLFGAGRGSRYMVFLTVSTGVGSGIIAHGRLYSGADGMAAEAGHMTVLAGGPLCFCGNRGCLEALASGWAMARDARELMAKGVDTRVTDLARGYPERVTARMVAQAAGEGDPEARRIIAGAMEYLGAGVAGLVNLLNPEIVVIGGSLAKMGEDLFGPVRRAVARRSFAAAAGRVSVVPAALGDDMGLLGSAAVAMQRSGDM